MEKPSAKALILAYLSKSHCGQDKAVTSKEMEYLFGIRGSEIRQIINALRCEGNPICSDAAGYYYAKSESDVKHSIAHLHSRAMKIIKARNGLIKSLEKLSENIQLTLEERATITNPH